MSGLFGYTGHLNEELTSKMATLLSHRGEFSSRYIEGEGLNVYILKDHNPLEEMSYIYDDAELSIGFSGIINDISGKRLDARDLKDRFLKNEDHFLDKLLGSFVGFIKKENQLFLFRDGTGKRSLYYSNIGEQTYFSVESKALRLAPGFIPKIKPSSVAQYLSFSFVPQENTMLEGIFEIQAGHVLKFEAGKLIRKICYFNFENEEKNRSSRSQQVLELRDLLRNSILDLVPEFERTAVFLSGGLDSSIVTAELAMSTNKSIDTYSIHFGKDYPNELDFARMVAEKYKTNHHEIFVSPKNFLPNLNKIIWHIDDPIGDPVSMPNYELAKVVSKDHSYVFNGEGGDPCFGGPKNLTMLLAHWYGNQKNEKYFRERQYLMSYRRAYGELNYLFTDSFLNKISEEQDLFGVLTPFFNTNQPENFLDKLMAINIRLKGSNLILPKVERMLAAANLTPLSPLFDERIVRYSFQIPGKLKLSNGIEKVALKEAYKNFLPSEIINRPKSGMRVPVHYWFQKEMKRYARRVLTKKSIDNVGIFKYERVKEILNYDTDEGPGRYGIRLWMLLTFEIWRRQVFDGEYR